MPRQQEETLFIRYRKGSLLYVPATAISSIRESACKVTSLKEIDAMVQQIKDGSGWGIAVESTWTRFVWELVHEFERTLERDSTSWRSVLRDYLELVTAPKPISELWPIVKEFLHSQIDLLSGWTPIWTNYMPTK